MGIKEHPIRGSILTCDFSAGFKEPEMIKNRPVIVLSPKIHARPGLCTVVCFSTTPPNPVMGYHDKIDLAHPLPSKFQSQNLWIKGDMVYAVGFHRLNLIRTGKSQNGKRQYYYHTLTAAQMKLVVACVLKGVGLSQLTNYL